MDELIAERIKGWQDVIDYLENEIKTVDDRSAGLPSLKAIEVTVLKTIIYALKEGKETQLAKVRDRPELSHTHKWENGETYNHSHKRGNISHGHHGSRYVKYRDRPVCPKCGGVGYLPDDDTGEPNPPVGGVRCPVCEGTGEAHRPDREKLITFLEGYEIGTIEAPMPFRQAGKALEWVADQISALFDGIRKDYDELILEMRREFDAKITLAKEVVRKDERERIATEELGIILPDYDRININAGIRKLMQALKEGK